MLNKTTRAPLVGEVPLLGACHSAERSRLMLGDDGLQCIERHGSALTPDDFSLAEEHEGRNGLDAIVERDGSVGLDIKLEDADGIAQITLQLFEHRMHTLARSAPGGEEIDQCEAFA